MALTYPSRVFANGSASTLFVTLPAALVTDSQFPFDADDEVIVTIENGALTITPVPEADE